MTNLIISFFVFLFSLYMLSKDDFILLRKNISLEQMFNYAFANVWIVLLGARILYVFFHPSLRYLNPLIFLIFIYFPGLSLTGGIIGSLIFLFFLLKKKTIPRERIYDIFSLSFLPGYICFIVLSQILSLLFIRKVSFILLIVGVLLVVITIIFTMLFKKDKCKDGTITYSLVSIYSLLTIGEKVMMTANKRSLLFDKEMIVLAVVFMTMVILLIRRRLTRRKR